MHHNSDVTGVRVEGGSDMGLFKGGRVGALKIRRMEE
jgi:hypothetical protein